MGAGESIKAEEAGAVAVPTTAAHEASLSLIAKKQSAADFNAEEAPMNNYLLDGVDYTAARSVKVCTIAGMDKMLKEMHVQCLVCKGNICCPSARE